MSREKYLSMNKNFNGYSFANIGLFTGFGTGIVNAVYSLVVFDIFRMFFSENSASVAVGVYAAIYAIFASIVGIVSAEFLHRFTKVQLLYLSLFILGACYSMMSFSIKPGTFISLDYIANFGVTMAGVLIPLFISDFSKDVGMAKVNARYHLWVNVGALIAPMFAMNIVNKFDGNYRAPLLAAGMIYFSGMLFFKHFGIVQQEKVLKRINIRKTLRALRINAKEYFNKAGMLRAYIVNFGFYALRAMRILYVPIVVVENGFSNDTLGLILSIGILPYVFIDLFIGNWIKKYGIKIFLTMGFLSFALFSFVAMFASGYLLLSIFILWQISGALMEAAHDLLFFNGMKRSDQARFYGIFRTSMNLPSVVAPVFGALCIALFGSVSAVWLITAVVGILSTMVLWSKTK